MTEHAGEKQRAKTPTELPEVVRREVNGGEIDLHAREHVEQGLHMVAQQSFETRPRREFLQRFFCAGDKSGGQCQQSPEHRRTSIPPLVLETDDESQEVETQRNHPKEGNDGDILTDMIRGREQHTARQSWEKQPKQPAPPTRSARRCDFMLGGCDSLECLMAILPERGDGKQHKHDEGRRPEGGLLHHVPTYFKEKRIAQQRSEGAEV